MMYDIVALQYLYGADFTTNNGPTVYSWNPDNGTTFVDGRIAIVPEDNKIFLTIWDGGGTDTYDLSNYGDETNLSIDLNPGGYSTFSPDQLAELAKGPPPGVARGSVFNALLYQGKTGSLIENANGGAGSDTITGNTAKNKLVGNGEIDTLRGLANIDTLQGGSGADIIIGGAENDIFDYDGGHSTPDMRDTICAGDGAVAFEGAAMSRAIGST